MPSLLHIEASPRGAASRSTRGAPAFVAALRALDPALAVDRLDLWQADLPPFDGAALSAKYARLSGRADDAREETAWAAVQAMVARLDRAERVLISTPMWNFSIPYRLKHWIDLITQPGLSFSFDPAAGYAPLLAGRPTLVVLASAGDYATGQSRGRPDLATPYLRAALGFIGLRDATIVSVGPTMGPGAQAAEATAEARLRALAPGFLEGAVTPSPAGAGSPSPGGPERVVHEEVPRAVLASAVRLHAVVAHLDALAVPVLPGDQPLRARHREVARHRGVVGDDVHVGLEADIGGHGRADALGAARDRGAAVSRQRRLAAGIARAQHGRHLVQEDPRRRRPVEIKEVRMARCDGLCSAPTDREMKTLQNYWSGMVFIAGCK